MRAKRLQENFASKLYRYPIGFSLRTGTKTILCLFGSISETVASKVSPVLYEDVGGIFSFLINPSTPSPISREIPKELIFFIVPVTFLSTW